MTAVCPRRLLAGPALFYKVQEILKQAFGYTFRFGKNSAGFIISTPPHPRKRAHEVFGGQIIKIPFDRMSKGIFITLNIEFFVAKK